MNTELRLDAYSDFKCQLSPKDARFLSEQLSSKIRVSRGINEALYLVNPQQYVGVVVLPSGRRITISPRIPTSTILYMLAVAYTFPSPFFSELERFQSLDELLEPVVEFFVDLVDERIRSGLYRAYVEAEDNLRVLRGRVDIPRDLRYNSIRRERIYCRFSELTWDNPENQVIRYVCYKLSGWRFRSKLLNQRLTRIFHQLDEVTLRTFTFQDAESFTYSRLNEPYRRIHRLCALFLESASLSEAAGGTEFRTFLLDMNSLFEKFVAQALLDRTDAPWAIAPQDKHYLGQGNRVRMRPDLVIRHLGEVWAVADCKYKPISEQSDYVNHDYYQVLAYCTALDVSRGVLIYPKHEIYLEDQIQVHNSNVLIRRVSVDLRGTPADLRAEMDRLWEALMATEITVSSKVAVHTWHHA